MALHPTIARVTDTIRTRSHGRRTRYLARVEAAIEAGPRRAHLSCGNQAHAYAAMPDKADLAQTARPNLGVVTAYNDMLSAHQPYERFPDLIRAAGHAAGATVQVAGGVPAMCDGVTQGRAGMELSLFSRDVIALAAGVALSHDTFDAALYLGICDKIVPGLVIAAASFGHLPAVFVPAGPMPSGLPNDEKAKVREAFAKGEVGRDALMAAEMASYHSPGTCTFYGTANSNQMLMEIMGLHLPGASFVNPDTPLRDALTAAAVARAAAITRLGNQFTPASAILDERAFVNGMVGLMATGGSTNLIIHIPAMARAAGIEIDLDDFAALSEAVPLLTRVYPNGLADVNHFHAAGGMAWLIGELLSAGLLHEDVTTVAGQGLARYTEEPRLDGAAAVWVPGPRESLNDRILRPARDPFASHGGLTALAGNLGRGVIKTSAVAPAHHVVQAPVRIFQDQATVKAAFQAGKFTTDCIVVVRFQGPRANGMPELHALTPILSVLQSRGLQVALLTDGRMSGASGKVPSAIHISPEAASGGPLAMLRDGDIVRLDAVAGTIDCLEADFANRGPTPFSPGPEAEGMGRELFAAFRAAAGPATEGAAVVV